MTPRQQGSYPHSPEWVSMKDYVDIRLTDLQRAVDKADAAMAVRLNGMNEFRQALSDQQRADARHAERYATKEAVDMRLCDIAEDINELSKYQYIAQGKASMASVIWAYAIAVIMPVALFILSIFIR